MFFFYPCPYLPLCNITGFDLAVARTVPMQAAVMVSYTACLRLIYSMRDEHENRTNLANVKS